MRTIGILLMSNFKALPSNNFYNSWAWRMTFKIFRRWKQKMECRTFPKLSSYTNIYIRSFFIWIQLLFAAVEWTSLLLVTSNQNQSNRRSTVQWYFPLWWVFSDCTNINVVVISYSLFRTSYIVGICQDHCVIQISIHVRKTH